MKKRKVQFDIVYSTDVKLVPTRGNAVAFADRSKLIDHIREAGIANRVRNLFGLPLVLQNLAHTPLVKSLHGQRGLSI